MLYTPVSVDDDEDNDIQERTCPNCACMTPHNGHVTRLCQVRQTTITTFKPQYPLISFLYTGWLSWEKQYSCTGCRRNVTGYYNVFPTLFDITNRGSKFISRSSFI